MFSDPEEIENLNIRFSNYPPPLNLPRVIQTDEIREIIRKQILDSALKIDGLPNRFLQILENLFVDIITIPIEAY